MVLPHNAETENLTGGQKFSIVFLVGSVVAVLGVLVLHRRRRRRKRKEISEGVEHSTNGGELELRSELSSDEKEVL